ncbi:hypothetical protein [Roseomonas sp. KE0001]|uniref:hypothetical protein n=1 Tax=unclassified Roseomonas TaxID=2617492 RepID=UPI0018E028D7|nr:hypothetical protein [Roseomonas sp. KE0001]MBI0435247.1 hypothetical protein [Roseomonas sp. KE0001]
MMPRLAALVPAALLALPPGVAQAQLRSLAVPAEAGLVVAARGQSQPRLVAPPAAVAAPAMAEEPAPVQLEPGGLGLAGPVGIVLPLVAGALLGVGAAGQGSGGAAPVRTR